MTDIKTISESCVMQRVRATARHVSQVYEQALKPVDLTASQFSSLVAIAREEGVNLVVLAERLGMDRTTLIRVLKPLERRGLVRIGASEKDARAKAVFLEPAGRALLNQAIPLWETAQSRALSLIGSDDLAPLMTGLQKLKSL
ncbi:MAG: MarR family winged helix-turn-helix transcriptional regulator [Pseudomonadota bacterium]